MATTVELEEAQAKLKEIIARLGPDGEVVITANQQPIARLTGAGGARPRFGNCRGMLTIVEDDDEHLKDFQDYMP